MSKKQINIIQCVVEAVVTVALGFYFLKAMAETFNTYPYTKWALIIAIGLNLAFTAFKLVKAVKNKEE